MDDDPFCLARFVDAQAAGGTYDVALAELRAGRKRSHWMWFVFPQLAGLGRSSTARHFAIASAAEARAYLAHPVLGPRLAAAMQAAADADVDTAEQLLGEVDALKLHSSASLFDAVSTRPSPFAAVLDRWFDGRSDPNTTALLE